MKKADSEKTVCELNNDEVMTVSGGKKVELPEKVKVETVFISYAGNGGGILPTRPDSQK
ncbi:hypothetical protein [Algicola sagamiensis]|uniref:hypothetical protein n=1 Tax=Algicola sagamiensis TaxID=163869 RepID=UPI000376D7D5|nr:hypothetical protein [Algicola sagamiensis]